MYAASARARNTRPERCRPAGPTADGDSVLVSGGGRRSPRPPGPSSRRTRWPARSRRTCPSTARRSGRAPRPARSSRPAGRASARSRRRRPAWSSENTARVISPRTRSVPNAARSRGERLDLVRRQAELLRLVGGVHLDEDVELAAGVVQPPVQRLGHLDRVQGVELPREPGHVPGLVGLQVPDHRPLQVGHGRRGARPCPPPPAPGSRRTAGARRRTPPRPAPAPWVLLTAISRTSAGSRPARRHAASIRSRTRARFSATCPMALEASGPVRRPGVRPSEVGRSTGQPLDVVGDHVQLTGRDRGVGA